MVWTTGWQEMGRIAGVAVIAYSLIVLLLRLSGKRTLSKLNAFDFIVTIALGSTLSSVIISGDLSVTGGATALAMLVALQFLVAWTTVHSKWMSRMIRSEPAYLYRDGELLHDRMTDERIRTEEVEEAVRKSGVGTFNQVGAIVLETDGTLSVIPSEKLGDRSALRSVSNQGQ